MDEAEIEHVSDREVPSSESGSGRRTAGPWEVVQPATTRASSRRTKRALRRWRHESLAESESPRVDRSGGPVEARAARKPLT